MKMAKGNTKLNEKAKAKAKAIELAWLVGVKRGVKIEFYSQVKVVKGKGNGKCLVKFLVQD